MATKKHRRRKIKNLSKRLDKISSHADEKNLPKWALCIS
jgi:hypothetical protein